MIDSNKYPRVTSRTPFRAVTQSTPLQISHYATDRFPTIYGTCSKEFWSLLNTHNRRTFLGLSLYIVWQSIVVTTKSENWIFNLTACQWFIRLRLYAEVERVSSRAGPNCLYRRSLSRHL